MVGLALGRFWAGFGQVLGGFGGGGWGGRGGSLTFWLLPCSASSSSSLSSIRPVLRYEKWKSKIQHLDLRNLSAKS